MPSSPSSSPPGLWSSSSSSSSSGFMARSEGGGDDNEEEDEWEYWDDGKELTAFWSEIADADRMDPVAAWLRWYPKHDASNSSLDPSVFVTNLFYDYWRIQVPRVLSPSSNISSATLSRRRRLEAAADSRLGDGVEDELIRHLESFIAGGSLFFVHSFLVLFRPTRNGSNKSGTFRSCTPRICVRRARGRQRSAVALWKTF